MNVNQVAENHAYDVLQNYVLNDNPALIHRGIEKEGLRTTLDYKIAQTDHPPELGQPLTHSSITTDYSEALLELITPVKTSREDLLNELKATHAFVLNNIGEEVIWVGSMPCKLEGDASIRIAEYGDSNIGQLKHVYRKGLDVRYGRIMQSIAGLHFNFSLSDDFWQALKRDEKNESSLQDYKSEKYFGLTRNFRRYSWLLMYLFGASPALDASFLDGKPHTLEAFDDKGSLFRPYATSLRMSDLGYNNNAQSALNICFNTLENFTNTLTEAIHTSYPAYEKVGLRDADGYQQLNTNILQIENEYYSPIRPKRSTESGEKPTAALINRGVEYVEVRCLDLNPYLPLGIDESETAFMDSFLLFCLLEESPVLSTEACDELERNFANVTTQGRKPGLMLERNGASVALKDWADQMLDGIARYASLLDQAEPTASAVDAKGSIHARSLDAQAAKVADATLCPSARVLSDMQDQNKSWLELAGTLSLRHKHELLESADITNLEQRFKALAEKSHKEAEQIKHDDQLSFDTFLEAYISA